MWADHLADLRRNLPGPEFQVIVEEPFIVVGDLSPAELDGYVTGTVRWAAERLRRQYFAKDPPQIDVWLFKDAASYRRQVRAMTGSDPFTPYGFYSAAHHGLFMNISTGAGTLVHEMVHPYIHANFPDCPAWFNEGLASLYEQCGDHNGAIWGYPNWRLPLLVEAIHEGRLGSFDRLCSLSEGRFYNEQSSLNYAQARYLCLYLQDQGLLPEFYRRLEDEPRGTKALCQVLQTDDLARFQREWESWCQTLLR